ncbi:hypothetical protein PJ15_0343 [Acinetobacter sp. neg1]|nr:hypothetical protein PJ15_0343 [Acinetobacter sp. neg1]
MGSDGDPSLLFDTMFLLLAIGVFFLKNNVISPIEYLPSYP